MISPKTTEPTVAELVGEITDEVRGLVAAEVALAKAELKVTMWRGIRAAVAAMVALLGGALLLIFGLVTLVEWLPNHTLVAGLVGLAGMVLIAAGGLVIFLNRKLLPFKETKLSLEEDLEWARRLSRHVRP
ncbi:MAG: phage holin family protein [Candidatus Dormibacteria bacterium]